MRKLVGIVGSGMIGRDPWDERCWSGLSRSFFTALQKRELLHRAFGVEAPALSRYALIAKNFAVPRRLWRMRFNLDARYYAALTRAIGRQLASSDYEHDFLQLGGIYDVPALVAGRARCFSYHDGNLACMLRSPYTPQLPGRKVRKAFAYEKRVYGGLTHIFVMSEHLRRSFVEDFEVPEQKVSNIGVGVNWAVPDRVDKDYAKREVLFIGIDFERKGGRHVVEAFRNVRHTYPDAQLHIVGPRQVPEVLRDSQPGVRFHGFLSRDDSRQARTFQELLTRCTLFVLPSLFEPFGVAVLEAMAYRMPALLSNCGAFPEIVIPGEHGDLVSYGDTADLADKMIALLADADTLARMGGNARDRVVHDYTWDRVAERLEGVVRAVAKSSAA